MTELRQASGRGFACMLLELIGRRCRLGVLLSGFYQRSLAQIESRIEGDDVKPVGSSLNFQCRGRNDNLEEGENAESAPLKAPEG